MLGELAEVITRRPGATLCACLAALLVAGVLALGAPSRLPVLDGVRGDAGGATGERVGMVLVTTGRAKVRSRVYRTSTDVITSAVSADPQVGEVRPGGVGKNGRTTALGVVFAPGSSSAAREQAATRIPAEIDPGPLELVAGGDAVAAVQARASVTDELHAAGVLAAIAIVIVLLLVAGWRFAAAAALASALGALGAVAVLRILSGSVDLSASGIAVAAVVGSVSSVETTIWLRARVRARSRERELAGALRSVLSASGSRLAAAALVAAAASLSLLAVDLPVARSAAIAAAAATLLGTLGALAAVPAILLLSEIGWTEDLRWRRPRGYAPAPIARLGDALFAFGQRCAQLVRRMLRDRIASLLGIVLVLCAMGALAAPAVQTEPVALSSAELPGDTEAGAAYELAKEQLGGAPGAGLGASFTPPSDDGLMGKLGIAGAVALVLAALGSFFLARKPLVAIVAGLTSVLPAAAAAGVLELAFGAGHDEPHAAAVICAASILVAISTARSAGTATLLRSPQDPGGRAWKARRARTIARTTIGPAAASTLAGLIVAGALATASLAPLRELGAGLGAGLALDLVFVRCLLSPSLARLAA